MMTRLVAAALVLCLLAACQRFPPRSASAACEAGGLERGSDRYHDGVRRKLDEESQARPGSTNSTSKARADASRARLCDHVWGAGAAGVN